MFALELIGAPDGKLPARALSAVGGPLRAALQTQESRDARIRALETRQPQSYEVSVDATRFGIEVSVASEIDASHLCMRHRIIASEVALPAVDRTDVLDQLPLALTVADRSGLILYVNPAARRLVGVSVEEPVIGTPVWRFVHPSGLDEAQQSGWQVRRGQMTSYERHLLRRSDGSSVPVETTTVPVRWDGVDAILVASHDLSGMESVERALEESQRLFSSVFHTSPIAISVSQNSDERFVDVNPKFLEYVGRRRDDVLGKSLRELGVRYDRERIEHLRALVVSGVDDPDPVESWIESADGRKHLMLCSASEIDVNGESCMLTMCIDDTALRSAREALQESEKRFRLMADAAPVLIWLSDSAGACTFFNRQWLEFVGRPMEAEIGDGWAENLHPDDYDRCVTVYQSAVQSRKPFSMEYRLRRHDGEYRWLLDRGMPRYEAGGVFSGFIGMCVDITERHIAEEHLRESKERAEEMTILKSAFLTNMTHEIRTPLTVILGFTSILRQGTRKEYQRFVSLIERSGRRLLLMLDSILDLAQLEAGTLEPEIALHGIDEIVRGVAGTLQAIAEDKGLHLVVEERGSTAYAPTDHAMLSRVLNNLIDNAIKFTEEGEVRLRVIEEPDAVVIQISDTGIGIHEDFLPRVFDAFAQESTGLTRTHQGSGLGLTVSRQLIELIGGTLTVSSRKGSGSTIQIRLPGQTRTT